MDDYVPWQPVNYMELPVDSGSDSDFEKKFPADTVFTDSSVLPVWLVHRFGYEDCRSDSGEFLSIATVNDCHRCSRTVLVAVVLSLFFYHFKIVGTREDTLISALCTGFIVKFFTEKMDEPMNRVLAD